MPQWEFQPFKINEVKTQPAVARSEILKFLKEMGLKGWSLAHMFPDEDGCYAGLLQRPLRDAVSREFTVVWEIEIDAASPKAAALLAQEWMRDRESSANVFTVKNMKTGKIVEVDLREESDDEGR